MRFRHPSSTSLAMIPILRRIGSARRYPGESLDNTLGVRLQVYCKIVTLDGFDQQLRSSNSVSSRYPSSTVLAGVSLHIVTGASTL